MTSRVGVNERRTRAHPAPRPSACGVSAARRGLRRTVAPGAHARLRNLDRGGRFSGRRGIGPYGHRVRLIGHPGPGLGDTQPGDLDDFRATPHPIGARRLAWRRGAGTWGGFRAAAGQENPKRPPGRDRHRRWTRTRPSRRGVPQAGTLARGRTGRESSITLEGDPRREPHPPWQFPRRNTCIGSDPSPSTGTVPRLFGLPSPCAMSIFLDFPRGSGRRARGLSEVQRPG